MPWSRCYMRYLWDLAFRAGQIAGETSRFERQTLFLHHMNEYAEHLEKEKASRTLYDMVRAEIKAAKAMGAPEPPAEQEKPK